MGVRVDLLTPEDLAPSVRAEVLAQGAACMSVKRLADYLEHIRQAAGDACQFVQGMDRVGFLGDRRTQRAVVMSLVIVGEAATKLMDHHPDFAAAHPQVPWRSRRGMRNRIAHG